MLTVLCFMFVSVNSFINIVFMFVPININVNIVLTFVSVNSSVSIILMFLFQFLMIFLISADFKLMLKNNTQKK